MTCAAVILARGGSKGLPGKNTATVGGRPCIAWTIDAAKRSELVEQVWVSSDDQEAMVIARTMGVGVIERPSELAGDRAMVDEAARHAFAEFDQTVDTVVILYGNVPIRPDDLIDRAIRMLKRSGCDSVQSYALVGKHHPWWTARVDVSDGQVHPWEGDALNHGVFRRQDLPSACIPDGGVIVCTVDALMLRLDVEEGPHAFFGRDRRGVMTGEGEVIDIDTRIDQIVADALLREREGVSI
ncbi:MAG: NTP transferase domain-containing protein [Phycisphaerales bacterium]